MALSKTEFLKMAKYHGAKSFVKETTEYKYFTQPDNIYALNGAKLVGHWSKPAGGQVFVKNMNEWSKKGRTFVKADV